MVRKALGFGAAFMLLLMLAFVIFLDLRIGQPELGFYVFLVIAAGLCFLAGARYIDGPRINAAKAAVNFVFACFASLWLAIVVTRGYERVGRPANADPWAAFNPHDEAADR